MKNHVREVEQELNRLPRMIDEGVAEAYIGGGQSKLRFAGLKVPQVDLALKKGFSFSAIEDRAQAALWDSVWHESQLYEAMSVALAWFESRRKKPNFHLHWPTLKKWSLRIDNWAHSDNLSSFYAQILESHSSLVLPTLNRWAKSSNPWLRRQSIVSLLYYSSARKKYLPANELLARIEAHLDDEAYYVQKGVGWTLREIHNIYPEATRKFLKRHLARLSAYAFSAATEKFDAKTKTELKTLRKFARKKTASKKSR